MEEPPSSTKRLQSCKFSATQRLKRFRDVYNLILRERVVVIFSHSDIIYFQ